VHRFAISFHRDKRSKHALHSELDEIKGIGPKTKDTLIKQFKSVKKIKEQNLKALTEVIGSAKASILYNYFHEQGESLE
jgi:excinuclease ABC subunit C